MAYVTQSLWVQRSCPLSSFAVVPSHHSNRPTQPRVPKVKFGNLDFAARKLAANGLYSPHKIRRSGIEGLRFSQSSIRLHHRVAALSLRKILHKEKLSCRIGDLEPLRGAPLSDRSCYLKQQRGSGARSGVRKTAQVVNLCRKTKLIKNSSETKNKKSDITDFKDCFLGSDLGRQQS
jgi:hypothetical protein